jgi:hypothetical protein
MEVCFGNNETLRELIVAYSLTYEDLTTGGCADMNT